MQVHQRHIAAVRRLLPPLPRRPLTDLGGPTLVDRYTIAHVAWGSALGAAGAPWWLPLGLSVAFELIESPLKRALPQIFPQPLPDRLINAVGDTSAVMAGWGAMRGLRWAARRASQVPRRRARLAA